MSGIGHKLNLQFWIMHVLLHVANKKFLKEAFDKHDDSKWHIIDSSVAERLRIPAKGGYSGKKRLVGEMRQQSFQDVAMSDEAGRVNGRRGVCNICVMCAAGIITFKYV